eukprot:UN08316
MSWIVSNVWDACSQIYTGLTNPILSLGPIKVKPRTAESILSDEIFAIKCNKTDPNNGIFCEPIHSNNIYKWYAILTGPDHTPYANGKYYLSIDIPAKYPVETPSVRFDTTKCRIAYIIDIDFPENEAKNDEKADQH